MTSKYYYAIPIKNKNTYEVATKVVIRVQGSDSYHVKLDQSNFLKLT
jgi:hypothetical protein